MLRSNFAAPLTVLLLTATSAPRLFAQESTLTVQYLHENAGGMSDDALRDDEFGDALAVGDFNADGREDLVIGVPAAQVGTTVAAGAFHVVYGRGPLGLYPLSQYWHQDLIGSGEVVEPRDRFGGAFAVGDFDGDGVDDLAVGAYGESQGGHDHAGQVHILFGSPVSGLSAQRSQLWHQDRTGVAGEGEEGDKFGAILAAGDFNADGLDDLVVGVPFEKLGDSWISVGDGGAGAVQVFPGQWGVGLTTTGSLWIDAGSSLRGYSLGGSYDIGEHFGSALAAGDFNNDGADDLAIGVPGDNENTGSVYVIPGSWAFGLTGRDAKIWTQNSPGMPDDAEAWDDFGAALASGDWNSDGFADLAIGAPWEDLAGFDSAGAVHILNGSILGLSTTGTLQITQDWGSLQDQMETGDSFGMPLAAGDFDHDGHDDLAISAQGEAVGTTGYGAGAVHIVRGSATGLVSGGNRMWHQNSVNIGGVATAQNYFGRALAAGDFDSDGADDLAIGTPKDDPGILDAGSVNALFNLDVTQVIIFWP